MKNITSLAAVSISIIALCGCGSTKNVSYFHITNNLSPEMHGLSERPSDDYTAFAIANNQNLRMVRDDFGRSFLLDHPSRLHPYPVLTTGGQAR